MSRLTTLADRWHRRTGLFAAAWLLVLGGTGFVLDHRDEWRWLWHTTLPAAWLPAPVAAKARHAGLTIHRVGAYGNRLLAGRRGIWWSPDDGRHWLPAVTEGHMPMVHAVQVAGQGRVWFATSDGLWYSEDFGRHVARRFLPGVALTSLSPAGDAHHWWLVAGRSRVLLLDTRNGKVEHRGLSPVAVRTLPAGIDLSRLVHDVHFGRGVFASPLSSLWNDAAGLALVVLPVSGLLFWYLPRRWRAHRRRDRPSARYRRQTMRWLFRLHAPVIGLVALVPIVYLSLTGIMLDHRQALRGWMKSVAIPRAWLPPVYALQDWRGEIRAVAGWPGRPRWLSVATRLGVFTSHDGGRHWRREALDTGACFVVTLQRVGDSLLAGGMGCANHARDAQGAWRPVAAGIHMPSDISRDHRGVWHWKNAHGIHSGTSLARLERRPVRAPDDRAPVYLVFEALHSGLLLHRQWKWINDLFAVLAVLLVVTGLVRWWRVKWI